MSGATRQRPPGPAKSEIYFNTTIPVRRHSLPKATDRVRVIGSQPFVIRFSSAYFTKRSNQNIDMAENGSSSSHDGVQIAGYASRDELMSVRIAAGTKRLFAALCENDRGRFIKFSDGRGKILVPGEGITQMREALAALETAVEAAPVELTDTTKQSGSPSSQTSPNNTGDGPKSELIATKSFFSEGRKFYFDVLENSRGRYIKISQSSTRRITIILPINGLSLLREGVDMLLEKSPPDTSVSDSSYVHRATRTVERVVPMQDGSSATVNVVQRELRVSGKRVVFESGANRRGSYLKIMESHGSQFMIVMLPHSAVPEMIQLLQEVVEAGDPCDGIVPARDIAQ